MNVKYLMLNGVEYADVKDHVQKMPPERREKIDRLRYDPDKLLSLAAGLMIRAEIGDTPIEINEHGKPYAVGSDKFFSVSHSGECAAITVDDREVGVDVEKLSDKDYMKIAQRFYHPNELAFVKDAEDPARAFTRIWTRKEAYLKQRGMGITEDLRAFDTTSPELSERIGSFDLDGYVLSVCSENAVDQTLYISYLELKELL